MKNIILLLCSLISFEVLAAKVEVDVISAEIGVRDQFRNKSLCVTAVRVPQGGKLLGLVEGIYDCYYARAAKKSYNHRIKVEMNDFKPIQMPELRYHLKTLDSQLTYVLSDGE
jgi:hypothetical protein